MRMVTSSALEIAMTLKLSYMPQSLPKLFENLSKNDNIEVKLMILNDYLLKHQEELLSIEYYRDSFPQCNFLLQDAIEAIKREIKRLEKGKEAQQGRTSTDTQLAKKGGFVQEPRADFMSPYTQQWNNPNQDKGQKTAKSVTLQAEQESGLLLHGPLRIQVGQFGGSKPGTNNQFVVNSKPLRLSMQNNNRLIWTVGLHERFEEALRYLGGHQVATPKKIRDYMKVEGLTVNQVKSHLQKYRLHKKNSAFASGELGMHAITSVDAWKSGIDCNDLGRPRAGRDSPVDGNGLEDLGLKALQLQYWLNE